MQTVRLSVLGDQMIQGKDFTELAVKVKFVMLGGVWSGHCLPHYCCTFKMFDFLIKNLTVMLVATTLFIR